MKENQFVSLTFKVMILHIIGLICLAAIFINSLTIKLPEKYEDRMYDDSVSQTYEKSSNETSSETNSTEETVEESTFEDLTVNASHEIII